LAAESVRLGFEIPIRNFDNLLEKISDEDLIRLIVRPIKSEQRCKKAARQIQIYFKKIASHPEMRSFLILKIKELVQYEKKGVKNE